MFLSIPGRKQTVVGIIAFIKAERCSLEKSISSQQKIAVTVSWLLFKPSS